MKHFKAPWGTTLVIVSTLATALCLGITFFRWQAPTPGHLGHLFFWLNLLPAALAAGCALFLVRGYTIVEGSLIIHRLFWNTRVPLADLVSAEFRPMAMRGSIRTLGNGGFFSFTGFYRSPVLGSYQAFVTDFNRTAILRFPARTIVVSPGSPEAFVQELCSICQHPPQPGLETGAP